MTETVKDAMNYVDAMGWYLAAIVTLFAISVAATVYVLCAAPEGDEDDGA